MAIREIVIYPDPVLRTAAEPVTKITPEIQQLLDDMAETMYDAPGIGLAAPQVGVSLRAIVVDTSDEDEPNKLYQILNPEIVQASGTTDTEEGCLSLPGIRETVTRNSQVKIRGLDREGKPLEIAAEGLFAVCLQHEIDHLNGVLIIDHLSKLKRDLAKAKLKKQSR